MLDGLGMAETTPGPLIMVVQFVGFMAAFRHPGTLDPMLAATLGAMLTTWVTFVPCFLWIFLGAPFIERLRSDPALTGAMSAITAAVVGVILNLAIWFALHVLFRPARPVERLRHDARHARLVDDQPAGARPDACVHRRDFPLRCADAGRARGCPPWPGLRGKWRADRSTARDSEFGNPWGAGALPFRKSERSPTWPTDKTLTAYALNCSLKALFGRREIVDRQDAVGDPEGA